MRRGTTIALATLLTVTFAPLSGHAVPVPTRTITLDAGTKVRIHSTAFAAASLPFTARPVALSHTRQVASDTGSAWTEKIDSTIGSRSVSVELRSHGRRLYSHAAAQPRAPASNMKLILSMALLDKLGPGFRLPTLAESRDRGGVINGNVWLLGRGDPSVASAGGFASSMPFGATRLGRLARKIKAAGVTAIHGRVMGSTGYFDHDWFAAGWKRHFPVDEVALPSALTFNGNVAGGRNIGDPELRAATALTTKLRKLGVAVWHSARAGIPPTGLRAITHVTSAPLWQLLRYMDRKSANFFAEVLGKRLAVERYGPPGTIARAAQAISDWAGARGVPVQTYDSSGLSYFDRVTARGIVRLLTVAGRHSWGVLLRHLLATGGEGTLKDRLAGVRVRAKTGTLDRISALSGWVWLHQSGRWAKFSILDHGMSATRAAAIEDSIVRTISRYAR
jgi:serine-type D-Ala-D-Ala carboxypeptidase/endopeptidase (penicillin-binding protein 4)